jgi:hypothetical protein
MGGRRRVIRQLNKPGNVHIAMFDTKVMFGDCKLFLGHPNPQIAEAVNKSFGQFMSKIMERASTPNLRDFYAQHFAVLEKLKADIPLQGESDDKVTGKQKTNTDA